MSQGPVSRPLPVPVHPVPPCPLLTGHGSLGLGGQVDDGLPLRPPACPVASLDCVAVWLGLARVLDEQRPLLGTSTSTFFMGPMGPGAGRVPQGDRLAQPGPGLGCPRTIAQPTNCTQGRGNKAQGGEQLLMPSRGPSPDGCDWLRSVTGAPQGSSLS